MEIKDIQIIPVKPRDGLIAFAGLNYGGIRLESIAIYTKLDGSGFRLLYPTKPVAGRETTVFHPIDRDTSEIIERLIIKKINHLFNKPQ